MDSQIQDQTEEIRAGAERARMEMEEAGSRLKQRAVGAWEDLTDVIRKHPAQALGIALVTGLAAGVLTSEISKRRSSPTDNLKDLAGSGSEAWGKIREGFDEALGTMKDALEDAVAKFK